MSSPQIFTSRQEKQITTLSFLLVYSNPLLSIVNILGKKYYECIQVSPFIKILGERKYGKKLSKSSPPPPHPLPRRKKKKNPLTLILSHLEKFVRKIN